MTEKILPQDPKHLRDLAQRINLAAHDVERATRRLCALTESFVELLHDGRRDPVHVALQLAIWRYVHEKPRPLQEIRDKFGDTSDVSQSINAIIDEGLLVVGGYGLLCTKEQETAHRMEQSVAEIQKRMEDDHK